MYELCGYSFPYLWPDPEGDVLIQSISSGNSAMVRCGLRQGRSYTPGAHPYKAKVRVIAGMGLFFLNTKTIPYYKGSAFEIPSGTPHAFIRVARDTVFTKEVSSFCHSTSR